MFVKRVKDNVIVKSMLFTKALFSTCICYYFISIKSNHKLASYVFAWQDNKIILQLNKI